MKFLALPHQLPPRIAAGLFILNSGLSKTDIDEEAAAVYHGMASGAYPVLKDQDPRTFVGLLSRTEIALGTALLIPAVPSLVAGAALTGFACGLVGLYLKTPGMRREGSLRPTEQGIALAKDIWLVGVGAGLVLDDLGRCRRHMSRCRHHKRKR